MANLSAEQRQVPDNLLRDYMRPWYAALSITIYRDIKSMALELIEFRHGKQRAEEWRLQAERTPVTATEAEQTRKEWSDV